MLIRIGDGAAPQYDAPAAFSGGKPELAPIDHQTMEVREARLTKGGDLFMHVRMMNALANESMELYFSRAEKRK